VINPYDEIEGVDELPAPPRRDITPADLELLTLAARALGATFEEVDGEGYGTLHFDDGEVTFAWNPLVHSDDAFNLAVRLRITPHIDGNLTEAEFVQGFCTEPHFDDAYAATRRAIVRAAAEIGKQHP
jgi:hypothetical protein